MNRGLLAVLFFFFALVAVNWLFSFAANIFPHGGTPYAAGPISAARGDTELTTITFNMFAKGGAGLNYVTQGYGVTPYSYLYPNHWHNGIDIAAAYGASVYSPSAGVVLA